MGSSNVSGEAVMRCCHRGHAGPARNRYVHALSRHPTCPCVSVCLFACVSVSVRGWACACGKPATCVSSVSYEVLMKQCGPVHAIRVAGPPLKGGARSRGDMGGGEALPFSLCGVDDSIRHSHVIVLTRVWFLRTALAYIRRARQERPTRRHMRTDLQLKVMIGHFCCPCAAAS